MSGKAPGKVIDPSKERVAAHIIRDPGYFIESVFSIVNQDSQRVPFILNPVQRAYMAKRTRRDIIVKARKMGFSSVILATFLHACITRKHTRAVVISHEAEATKRLFRRVHEYLEHSLVKVRVSVDAAHELRFPDTESWFYVGTAGSKAFGRGDDLTHVHLSEVGFYSDPSIITGIQEAMVNDSYIVQESTANGAGTAFHQAWVRAGEKDSAWVRHFFGWQEDSRYRVPGAGPTDLSDDERSLRQELNLDWEQIAWRRSKLSSMNDPSLFQQEYPASHDEAFLVSGRMVFDWKAIRRQEAACQPAKWTGDIVDIGSGIEVRPDPRGPFTVWMTPQEGKKYLVVADAADGVKGGAFSVADVYDIRTWEQVAQWRGHLSPADFADLLMRLGAFYGWAVVAPECNYPGNAVLERMQTACYPSIFSDPETPNGRLGWMTTTSSKAQYISDGRRSLDDGSIKINSKSTLAELRTFMLADGGKMQPQEGCWQDTVVVCCKAANILKDMRWEPERTKRSFRDVMNMPRRSQTGPSGGEYQAKVV